jgi:hypothetical protein
MKFNDFLPLRLFYENSEVHWDSNSQSGSSLGNVEFHSLTLSYAPKSMKCDSQASLLAHTFASPCLGREPKVKVVTLLVIIWFIIFRKPSLRQELQVLWSRLRSKNLKLTTLSLNALMFLHLFFHWTV